MLRFLSVAIATVLTASVWCEKNFSVDEQNISNESSFDESWIEEFQVRTETSFQYTSINIPSHGLARLTRDLCYNYTSDMVVVDTRTTTWDDAVTFLSDNLYFPYLVLYGSLHQDDRFFDSHNWTFFMQPSLSDYGRLFQDLIQLFNVSSDTITVIYDDQNKDLLAVFDSYSEMGSTFLLMFNVRHILDRNVLKELHYTMDARDFLVVANTTTVQTLLETANAIGMLTEFHRWVTVVTDTHVPTCTNCTEENIILVLPIALEAPKSCNLSSLYRMYFADTMEFIRSVAETTPSLSGKEIRDICCPVDTCFSRDITATREFTLTATNSSFSGCAQEFVINSTTGHRNGQFELYRLRTERDQRILENLGTWNSSEGLTLLEFSSLYPKQWATRRIRVITIHEPPFVFRNDTSSEVTYHGYSIDVLERIAKSMQFTYEINQCEDGTYGSMTENDTWGGCIGQIISGEADMIVGPLSVTTERETVVDFTLPYYDFAGIQILMKKMKTEQALFYFLTVFTPNVWLCLAAVLLATSIMLFFFDKFSPCACKDQFGRERVFDMKESMWFVIGSLTMSGGGEAPTCVSSRILVAGYWFFCIIMMSTFTANLAAFLTVSRMTANVESLEDLSKQTAIGYSVLNGTSVMRYFQRMAKIESSFDTKWKEMNFAGGDIREQESLAVWDYPLGEKYGNIWKAIKKNGLLNSSAEAMRKVMTGNFAFLTDSPVVKYETSRSCQLISVGDQFSSRPYAFALKENSPLVREVSARILQLQQATILEKLKTKWWERDKVDCPKETINQGLDFVSLAGTFVVIAIGLGCGLVLLVLELLWSKYGKKNKVSKYIARSISQKGRLSVISDGKQASSSPVPQADSPAVFMDKHNETAFK